MTRNLDDVLLSRPNISFFCDPDTKRTWNLSRRRATHTASAVCLQIRISVSHVKSVHYHHSTGGRGREKAGEQETKFTDISAFSPLDKGEPGKNLYYVLYECVYLPVIYGHLCLTEGGNERKGIHDRESYWTQENAHINLVNSKSASRVYRFRPGTQNLSLSVKFGPRSAPMPSSGRQAAAPTSLISAFPWDTRSPFRQRKKCQAPRGWLRHARAGPPTPARLRTWGGRTGGRLAFPKHTPSAPGATARPEPPYLRGPRATGARGASSSQWLPLPPPPPAAAAAAVTAAAAGGRDTTSSGLHRHVRRAANCIVGGKGDRKSVV